MKNTKQGSTSQIIIAALALLLAASAVYYFMQDKTPSEQTDTAATTTETPATNYPSDTKPTASPVVMAGFKSAIIGDLAFNFKDADYTLEDNSPAQFGTGPLILTSKKNGLTVYVARKTQDAANPIPFTEETVKAESSVKGGVDFNKLTVNNLTVYEGTAPYKTSEYALTYSIIYNRNLYTFTILPGKTESKMSELKANKASFAAVLNSIQAQK
jgi:hypothetical protein